MYCKHCYRMMEDGLDICPACGKSQQNRTTIKKVTLWIGLGTWFACMVAFSFIGTILKISSENTFFSILSWGISILTSIIVARPKAPTSNSQTQYIAPYTTSATLKNGLEQDRITQDATSFSHDNNTHAPLRPSHDVSSADIKNAQLIANTHKVTGIQHYMDAIIELASENPDYDMTKKEIIDSGITDERIWKYEFYVSKAELLPEPDNLYDPKAIKVLVDGKHVGYIKSGSCARVLKSINAGKICSIDCTIGGGPYKIVYEEYDDEKDRDVYILEKDETSYFVRLTVYEAAE